MTHKEMACRVALDSHTTSDRLFAITFTVLGLGAFALFVYSMYLAAQSL